MSISLYLFIRTVLLLIEVFYSIFVPWLRRWVLLAVLLYLPGIGLWVAAVYVRGPHALGPIFAAIYLDYTVPVILDSRLVQKATILGGYGKALDPQYFTGRIGSFFHHTGRSRSATHQRRPLGGWSQPNCRISGVVSYYLLPTCIHLLQSGPE